MNLYLSNILAAVQGKRSEGFQEEGGSTGSAAVGGVAAIVWILIGLLPYILFAYGAAKLSWCLNQSYGWSFLCFLFPGFYYPYYAFFLNPLCTTVAQVGGRRR
jgi:hypothetical protein